MGFNSGFKGLIMPYLGLVNLKFNIQFSLDNELNRKQISWSKA